MSGKHTKEGSSPWGSRGDLLLLAGDESEVPTPDALVGVLLRNLIALQGAGKLQHTQPTNMEPDTFAVRITLGDIYVVISHVGGQPGNVHVGEFTLEIDEPGSAPAFIVASFLPVEQRVALRHLWSAIWETELRHLRNAVSYTKLLIDADGCLRTQLAGNERKEAEPKKTL